MSKYKIQVELFKGEDSLELPDDYDGDNYSGAIYGAQLAFDKGTADKVVFYISRKEGKEEELVSIITKSKAEFDVKEVAVEMNQIIEEE